MAEINVTTSLIRRFWAKVDKRGPNECWPWIAAKTNGYGVIGIGGREDGIETAHRISWVIHNGPIPDGHHVLHTCDDRYPVGDITNRACTNPNHLETGPNAQNVGRMVALGRHARGETNGQSILTEEVVIAIRNSPRSSADEAKDHDVSASTIASIRRRDRWKHV